jgi:hypothetical protein
LTNLAGSLRNSGWPAIAGLPHQWACNESSAPTPIILHDIRDRVDNSPKRVGSWQLDHHAWEHEIRIPANHVSAHHLLKAADHRQGPLYASGGSSTSPRMIDQIDTNSSAEVRRLCDSDSGIELRCKPVDDLDGRLDCRGSCRFSRLVGLN